MRCLPTLRVQMDATFSHPCPALPSDAVHLQPRPSRHTRRARTTTRNSQCGPPTQRSLAQKRYPRNYCETAISKVRLSVRSGFLSSTIPGSVVRSLSRTLFQDARMPVASLAGLSSFLSEAQLAPTCSRSPASRARLERGCQRRGRGHLLRTTSAVVRRPHLQAPSYRKQEQGQIIDWY